MKKRLTIEFPDGVALEILDGKKIVVQNLQYVGDGSGCIYIEMNAYPKAPIGMTAPKPYITTPIKRPSRKKS